MEFQDLSKAIAESFPKLSPQLRRAARHALDRPDDVALQSMRQLASAAGVHPSTMVRLARALDFPSYNDFRAAFQRRLRGHPPDFLDRARRLQGRGGEGSEALIEGVRVSVSDALAQSFAVNGTPRFEAAAASLAAARRIYVAGHRSCYTVAYFFDYLAGMIGEDVHLAGGAGRDVAGDLHGFDERDVLLAAGFEPYSREVVDAVAYADEAGGAVVALTDSLVSPLARDPALTILIRNESPSFFQSLAPAVAVVEALVALLVVRRGEVALKALGESDIRSRRFRSYWSAGADG